MQQILRPKRRRGSAIPRRDLTNFLRTVRFLELKLINLGIGMEPEMHSTLCWELATPTADFAGKGRPFVRTGKKGNCGDTVVSPDGRIFVAI
jgi:hypothetical protein